MSPVTWTAAVDYFRRNGTLTMLCVQAALTMMGQGLISPVLPLCARSFGVSLTMVGLLITAFGVARIGVNIPAGRLAERFGRRPVIIAGPVLMVISSVASGLTNSFWQLLAFRFVQGLGSAMYMTGAMIMLADLSTPANRGRVMSLYQGSHLVGAGLGPTLGGFTAQYLGMRAPFFVFALFAALAALWAYLRLPETRQASGRPESGRRANGHRSTAEGSGAAMKSLLRDLNFILISVVTFSVFFTRNGARNQILPLLASERLGASVGEIGIAVTIISLIDVVTLFLSGWLSDRFGRKMVIVPGCLVCAVSLAMLSQTYSYWFLILTCVLWGIGVGVSGPSPAAYVADITPKEHYSAGMSLYRTTGDLGFILGPVLLGWLADTRGFTFSLLFNAILLLVGAVLFQVSAKEPRRSPSPGHGAHG